MTLTLRTALAGLVAGLAAAAIAGGFLLVGPPEDARARRLDDTRVGDLRGLKLAVDAYWAQQKALPASLADLESRGLPVRADPVSKAPYEYRVLGEMRYELCATFDRASDDVPSYAPADPFWAHTAGRQCFALDVKKPT